MNKQEFLQKIRSALQGLAPAEIDEILADYGNHFDESVANGRSEEATAAALGDPIWLGQEHVADMRHETGGLLGALTRLWANIGQRRHNGDEIIAREYTWTPGSRMAIRLPVEVSWRPAEKARAMMHGPAWLIEHVRLDSQELRGRFKWRLFHNNRLRLELEGPAIETWSVLGSANVRLLNVSQSSLCLELAGSGDIKCAGHVQNVTVNTMGSGDIDLSLLEHTHGIVKVMGSGDVTLEPSEEANLSVEGSGDIILLSKPKHIIFNIMGSGDIQMPDGIRLSK